MRPAEARVSQVQEPAWTTEDQFGTSWTYLSNHAHVLVCLSRNPRSRLRDIARLVGLTERGVSRILSELEISGVIEKERVGRRNRYTLHLAAPLRHPLERHATVAELIELLTPGEHRPSVPTASETTQAGELSSGSNR